MSDPKVTVKHASFPEFLQRKIPLQRESDQNFSFNIFLRLNYVTHKISRPKLNSYGGVYREIHQVALQIYNEVLFFVIPPVFPVSQY